MSLCRPEIGLTYASASATVSLASPSTPHFLTSTASLTGTSTTFRLQTPQLPPPTPPPLPLPPPPPLSHSNPQPSCPPSTLSGPQPTSNVQFMSVLTPSPSVASGVQHSPIQLFNLAPMHGYISEFLRLFSPVFIVDERSSILLRVLKKL